MDEKIILINFTKKILLNSNKSFLFKNINNIKELNHDEIVVAIGMIIKPISEK